MSGGCDVFLDGAILEEALESNFDSLSNLFVEPVKIDELS
jgi:hypothetical protein